MNTSNRIELDETTRGNYDTQGKSKLSLQENYIMWTLGDDDVGTKLTSGLTRVKKDRDYCVKLDLIPLASNLTLTGTGCNAIINRKQGLSQKNVA